MDPLGIDFGTSRLRIAGAQNGSVGLMTHRFSSGRLLFVVESRPFRITGLKRMLDFEKALPVPPSGVGSTALVAQICKDALADCCPDGWNQRNAMVTVPPCFSQRQRSALRSVMADSGLARVRLVDDTFAALMASWEHVRTYTRVLVYSWGAGVFSVAFYCMKSDSYQLISQEGNRQLGGDDFDAVLAEAIVGELNSVGSHAAPRDAEDFTRIAKVAEDLKRSLSQGQAVTVPLSRLLAGRSGEDLEIAVPTETIFSAIEQSTEAAIELALRAATPASGAEPEAVLMVGGTTLSPIVREALGKRFGFPIIQAQESAVAVGAVLCGQRLRDADWENAERTLAASRRQPSDTGEARSDAPIEADAGTQPPASRSGENQWVQTFGPLLDAAQREYEAGHLESAIAAIEQAMDVLGRFSGDLYRKTATALSAEGKRAAAVDLLRRANKRDPGNRFVAVDFAQACCRQAAKALSLREPQATTQLAQEGADSLRCLPAGESTHAKLLALLLHLQGVGLWAQGKLAQAIPILAECVRLDPQNPTYSQDLDAVRKMLKQVGPNDKCPCGSGLKYKKCCGRAR